MDTTFLAAVDLGSNSFRLSIGRVVQQDGITQIFQVDRLKETVRLAAGLNADGQLDHDTIARAVNVLERFGERLRGFPAHHVRAVATNTFRVARNTPEVLVRAEAALGFPIDVISGQEEARLIFSGVVHSLPRLDAKRLVVDIGGGSTEMIIGKGLSPKRMNSLPMGCVSYSRAFFADGRITQARMQEAELAARREIEALSGRYRKTGWQEAYGSSGTAKALYAILTAGGAAQTITAKGLRELKQRLIRAGRVVMCELPGIKPSRVEVLPGGLAIMSAIFDELKIEQMTTGEGALRVGVLYDLLGRDHANGDVRLQTVYLFMKRYHIDTRQAGRVRDIALTCFDRLCPSSPEADDLRLAVGWAAQLHEIGLSIAHDNYHRHSAYILEHADMPGFSNAEQALLAQLALAHKGKLGKMQPQVQDHRHWLAVLSLRLAVLLMRKHQDNPDLPLSFSGKGQTITLTIDRHWLAAHPLTHFNLNAEMQEWCKIGYQLKVVAG